jgi:hypothetical protein
MGEAIYTDKGRSVDVYTQDYPGELLDLVAGVVIFQGHVVTD